MPSLLTASTGRCAEPTTFTELEPRREPRSYTPSDEIRSGHWFPYLDDEEDG